MPNNYPAAPSWLAEHTPSKAHNHLTPHGAQFHSTPRPKLFGMRPTRHAATLRAIDTAFLMLERIWPLNVFIYLVTFLLAECLF